MVTARTAKLYDCQQCAGAHSWGEHTRRRGQHGEWCARVLDDDVATPCNCPARFESNGRGGMAPGYSEIGKD